MKLVTFIYKNKQKIGHLCGDVDKCDYNDKGYVIDISTSFDYINMLDFIKKDGINNSEVKEYIYSDKVKKLYNNSDKFNKQVNFISNPVEIASICHPYSSFGPYTL